MMSVFTDIHDLDGLAADTERGQAMGFVGRTAIHPRQVPVIAAAFAPTDDEVAWASEVLAATAAGGVTTLASGEMVDPAMRRPRRVDPRPAPRGDAPHVGPMMAAQPPSPRLRCCSVRFRLLPTDDQFFQLFNDAAANVADCARLLRDLLDGAEGGLEAVVACERRGDELIRDILRRLNTSFVTPFDREDIHALAEELDDVVDDVMEVGYRLQLGNRDVAAMPELKQQADLLVQMADETVALVDRLGSMKGTEPFLNAIDRLESEGDAVYRQALARLYSGELKASATLYWKDVVDTMEAALDALEDASDVIEGIVLKHA